MDRKILYAIRDKINLTVVWYLIYQYLLYVKGVKVMSDRVYKVVRYRLLWEWEDITHPLKDILDKEEVMIDATFSRYEDSYPKEIVTYGKLYLKEYLLRAAL